MLNTGTLMPKRHHWARRLTLLAAALCLATRFGLLPTPAYHLLYLAFTHTASHFGVPHHHAVLAFHQANCHPYRTPRPIRWLAQSPSGAPDPASLHHLFTCSAP